MKKNKEQLYIQCLLRKRSGNISILDVAWIPIEYGVIGKCLKFWKEGESNEDSSESGWDDNWVILKIYGVRNESDIVKMNWDYRKWDWIRE